MRKGQQKILDKAAQDNFVPAAIKLLKDETKTIAELDMMYRYLCVFLKCQQEYIDNYDTVNSAIDVCDGYYIRNNIKRTFEMADFIKNHPQIVKADFYYISFLANKTFHSGGYCFGWDDIEKFIENATDFDSIFDFIYHTDENLTANEIVRMANICEKAYIREYSFHMLHYDTIVKRIHFYWDKGIDDDTIAVYERLIWNGDYDKVAIEFLSQSYPIMPEFISCIKSRRQINEAAGFQNLNDHGAYFYDDTLYEHNIAIFKDNMQKGLYDSFGKSYHYNIGSMYLPCTYIQYDLSLTGISISLSEYDMCDFYFQYYDKEDKDIIRPSFKKNKNPKVFLITNDFHIYKKIKSGKWIPAMLTDLFAAYNSDNTMFFIKMLIKSFIDAGKMTWKDVTRYLTDKQMSKKSFPKLTANEITDSHSFNDAIQKHYKKAGFVNWNKCDPRLGFFIMKSLPMVDDKSFDLLLSMKYMSADRFSDEYGTALDYLNSVDYFLWLMISKRLSYIDNDAYFDFSDYIIMCREQHEKISLTFRSPKKIKAAHDRLLVNARIENTPIVTVPKKSKFNGLRKIIPDDFVWITTRKRLVEEAVEMHHCVASYAKKINRDNCAIYSWFCSFTQKRYTIEFCIKNGKYYIRQMYGKFDAIPSKEAFDYVQDILDKKQEANAERRAS